MNPICIGAAQAAIGVILGAFGTHGLRGKIGYDLLQIYETGTYYLVLHALALILFGLIKPKKMWPAWCFLAGSVVFAGSLYGITFSGIRQLGAITPVGGVMFIAGWIGFALEARKKTLI